MSAPLPFPDARGMVRTPDGYVPDHILERIGIAIFEGGCTETEARRIAAEQMQRESTSWHPGAK